MDHDINPMLMFASDAMRTLGIYVALACFTIIGLRYLYNAVMRSTWRARRRKYKFNKEEMELINNIKKAKPMDGEALNVLRKTSSKIGKTKTTLKNRL